MKFFVNRAESPQAEHVLSVTITSNGGVLVEMVSYLNHYPANSKAGRELVQAVQMLAETEAYMTLTFHPESTHRYHGEIKPTPGLMCWHQVADNRFVADYLVEEDDLGLLTLLTEALSKTKKTKES